MFLPYDTLEWPTEIKNEDEKRRIASELARFAKDGDVIGVGSGTTSFLGLLALAERIKFEGLRISIVTSSLECQWYAESAGIEIHQQVPNRIDWAFDGADEIDKQRNLIKGRGGALLRERQVLEIAKRIIIVADSSKYVERLGDKFLVPVEVDPAFARRFAFKADEAGTHFLLRMGFPGKDGPLITESGNLLFDCRLAGGIQSFEELILDLPGVRATGLFTGFDIEVLV